MSVCEELHKLLSETVIHEVDNVVGQMDAYAREHELTPEMQEEQTAIRVIRDNFLNIIQAIELQEIEEENCRQILEELTMVRSMGNMMPPQ